MNKNYKKALCGLLTIHCLFACSIYQTTVAPVYRSPTSSGTQDPFLLIADIGTASTPNKNSYSHQFGDLDQALKEASYLRYSKNARIVVRYALKSEGSDTGNYFLACVSLLTIPGRQTSKWKLQFDVYDRIAEETLLTYSYNIRRHEYFGHLVWFVGAPVAGAIEGVRDLVSSVSTDETKVYPAKLVVERFMSDLRQDFKARAQLKILTSGEKLDGIMMLGEFTGKSGAYLVPFLQNELVRKSIPLAQNYADRRIILRAQGREATGLYVREIKIGRLAGATSILVGHVNFQGEYLKGSFRLLNVERGVVVWTQNYSIRSTAANPRDQKGELSEMARQVAYELDRIKGRI